MGQSCFLSNDTNEKTDAKRNVSKGKKEFEFTEVDGVQTSVKLVKHSEQERMSQYDHRNITVHIEHEKIVHFPSVPYHENFKTFPKIFESTSAALSLQSCEEAGMPSHALASAEDGDIVLLDYITGQATHHWKDAHKRDVNCLTRPLANGLFASTSRDKFVKVWNVQTREMCCELAGHKANVTGVSMISDGDFLVSGSRDNTVRLWDVARGVELDCCDIKLNIVHFVRWVPQLHCIAQGGEDLAVRLWDVRMGSTKKPLSLKLTSSLNDMDYHPICCDMVPDEVGCTLLTGHNGFNGHGGYIVEWDLRLPEKVKSFHPLRATVRALRCCSFPGLSSSDQFLSASDDSTLAIISRRAQSSSNAGVSIDSNCISESPEGRVTCLDACKNGDILASTWSGAIVVFRPTQTMTLDRFRYFEGYGA